MVFKSKQSSLRILIIDDNLEIHQDFIKILTKNSTKQTYSDEFEKKVFGEASDNKITLPQFQIDTASQGREGVEYAKEAVREENPYALAFVDIRMPPGWNGIETIKHLWKIDPDIQIVICTAFSDYSWEETVDTLGQKENLLILKKPFDSVAVRQLACALTKKWQLIQDARNYTTKLEQDIKDRTASLEQSLSLVKATLESSSDGILVIDNQGNIVDCNQKFINMWKIPHSFTIEKNEEKIREYMRNQLENPINLLNVNNHFNLELETIKIDIIKFKDGKIFEYYTQPQKINNKTVGRVFDFRDITKRLNLEKDLKYQATHDYLTGLPNRVMLLERIKQAINMSKQNQTEFAILFLDFDRFKLINDSLNHAMGDEVLKIASTRLQSHMRAEDTLSRLGGDEFIIVLANLNNEENIIKKIHQLQKVFYEPFTIARRDVIVTASMGISVYPRDGATADILLRNADAAMYRAKEQPGNSFQFYTDELSALCLAKLEKEMQLRRALENDELFLCYQPQIDLKNGKIVAAEALLRWHHPTKGVLLPLDFIQLAEETGLIIPIGELALRKACEQNKAWQKKGLPPIRIAVNVTVQQFSHQDIFTVVSNILKETDLDPKYLELELTENVIVSNPEVIKTVTKLKNLGVMVAIDDFGTGYSSLSYLKKIPLDRLKIDSSFIQHIQNSNDDEVIIRAVIAMAKNLNLEVLAEGVETQNQLNFLKTHECGDVQGFYFSYPLTVDELEIFLKEGDKLKIKIMEKVNAK